MRLVSRFFLFPLSTFLRRDNAQLIPTLMTAVVIGYSLFMAAALDLSTIWLHKINVDDVATASCKAGARDINWVAQTDENYLIHNNYLYPGATPPDSEPPALASFQAAPTGFPLSNSGSDYDANVQGQTISGSCDASNESTVAMCAYAKANGYTGGVNGDVVRWILAGDPQAVTMVNPNGRFGVAHYTPPSAYPSTPVTVPYGILPYLNVQVSEPVHVYLLSLIPGVPKVITVSGVCHCGVVEQPYPVRVYPRATSTIQNVTGAEACDFMPMHPLTTPTMPYMCRYGSPDLLTPVTINVPGANVTGTLNITSGGGNAQHFSGLVNVALSYSCNGGGSYTSLKAIPVNMPPMTTNLSVGGISAACPSAENMMLALLVSGSGSATATGGTSGPPSGPGVGPIGGTGIYSYSPPPVLSARFTGTTINNSTSGQSAIANAWKFMPTYFGID